MSTPRPGHFTLGTENCYPGGWLGPITDLDRRRKSRPTGIRSADSPARSEWDVPRLYVLFIAEKRLSATLFRVTVTTGSRSRCQWPCSKRRRSAAAQLLGSRVQIPLRAQMFVSCVCCVFWRYWPLLRHKLSFRGVLLGLCECVCVCVFCLETSTTCRSELEVGFCDTREGRGEKGEE